MIDKIQKTAVNMPFLFDKVVVLLLDGLTEVKLHKTLFCFAKGAAVPCFLALLLIAAA